MTVEEAKAWFEQNRERLRKELRLHEEIEDLPDEATPGGMLLGPRNDIEYARILREIREGGADDAEGEPSLDRDAEVVDIEAARERLRRNGS
jgi:hypothetical protein